MPEPRVPDRPIVDRAEFDRASMLLVFEIPEHINECPACRKGDAQLRAALDTDDHAAAALASRVFCVAGNALIQEYAECAAKGLGYPWPLKAANDRIPCRICGIPAERHSDTLGHVWAEP